MRSEERELIVKHAFESPDGLRISLLVHFAFPAIKMELIRNTLVAIRDRVAAGMGKGNV